jgi:tagatose 1,6-diphosphate aldolase/sulfofructosephosphate aldolase
MSPTTAQPVRTLDDIADEDGDFAIIAMDQRNTLRRMFTAVGIEATDEDLRQSKADVAQALSPTASGILFDPTYGVPAVMETGALHSSCGLLVASEPSVRGVFNGEPRTHRAPELDAQWVLDQGGDANKFFAQLRADRPAPRAGEPDLVAECLDAVQQVVDDCRAVGIPSVIENLVYPLPDEDLSGKRFEDAVIEAARALNELDIDLLKLEYPGSPEGCRRLAGVVDRPWAVLSAGVPFDQFTEVLQVSFDEGGASGFIAGRSVWRESLPLAGRARQEFLETVARPRLDTLRTVAAGRARPWREATARTDVSTR